MAIKDVESKCWILALFVRDDGERFLLGDGSYEFTEKQLHFAANTMANDVVEVQGNDGYLLAGQVRRPSTQTFDGYVGDSSTSKALVEERRRAFFAFFRKNFFYKVIYIFPDGSAIQRKRGFLVDAPEVKEIRQIYPEYHVALNFEDINYYYYDEDSDGQEIYGKSATINLNSVAQSGGLIWLLPSEMTLTGEGTSFTLSGTVNGTALTSAELKGNTYQQTYSGKNLFNFGQFYANRASFGTNVGSITVTENSLQYFGNTSTDSQFYYAQDATNKNIYGMSNLQPSTEYTISYKSTANTQCWIFFFDASNNRTQVQQVFTTTDVSMSFTTPANMAWYSVRIDNRAVGDNTISEIQIEAGPTATSYEPYVGGIAAPNPDYPQEVQTATGRQVVTISNDSQSQEYEINLGKNLLPFVSQDFTVNSLRFYVSDGSLYLNGTNSGDIYSTNSAYKTNFSTTLQAGTYTISGNPYLGCYIRDMNNNALATVERNGSPATFTLSQPTEVYLSIYIGNNTTFSNTQIKYQLEKGSTATTYAPYFEPIELCKIGTYQDRIYRDGSDWYLRKETNKLVFDGSDDEQWGYANNGNFYCDANLYNGGALPANDTELVPMYCNSLIARTYRQAWINHTNYSVTARYDNNSNPRINNQDYTTAADFKAWLASEPVVLYYPLATSTDTQITNTALIDQLNALAAATTYNGSTSFTVDGNSNLAAILAVEVEAVGGGGVEWDENGAVWEEGKPSYSIISVDSIDNVYPVLTITGRTVNPVLTDVTTGTIFQYNGTITDSQVLRVDMMSKTATLNGVSVIGNVTGDWLYLAPGNNRITYTADNADAPNATVEWQEIVG